MKILYFALLRDITHKKEEDWQKPEATLGNLLQDLVARYGSPFAVETATFTIRDSDVCAEVTRSAFDTARQFREGFDIYGSKMSFEWPQVEGQWPLLHVRGRPEPSIPRRVIIPDYTHLLPGPFSRVNLRIGPVIAEPGDLLQQDGGHGGSHPHLVHAWIGAIRGERPAFPDAMTSANWTMVGIQAHRSAMSGNATIRGRIYVFEAEQGKAPGT